MTHRPDTIGSLTRFGFFLTAVVAAGLALYPNLQLPEPSLTRGFTDKIYHFVGCMLLVLLAARGWQLPLRYLLLALPLSMSSEFVQGLVPGRGVHVADMASNVAGVTLAMFILSMVTASHQGRKRSMAGASSSGRRARSTPLANR